MDALCQSQFHLFVAISDKGKKWATYNKEIYTSLLLNSKILVVIFFIFTSS